MKALKPARLRTSDLICLGLAGLRTRTQRVALACAGIAIGVAAMLALVGISASGQAQLERELERLGTDLLTVSPGTTLTGGSTTLPAESIGMVGRIGAVTAVSATGRVAVSVYRNDRIPAGQTGSIAVLAVRADLPAALGCRIRTGTWLDPAAVQHPVVVLGATAARRLGIRTAGGLVWLGGQWFGVGGILEPVPLAPELDVAALVGWAAAVDQLGFDGHPTTIYVRSAQPDVEAVRAVLGAVAKPEAPHEVRVSRPSDALLAQRAAGSTLSAQLLGLGLVALLIGGIGVANTMVISVLERRSEIGLRRALGATRGRIGWQFLTEAILLALLGGFAGTVLGGAATAGHALLRDWPVVLPAWAIAGGLGVTVVVGALAGIYPAVRAARLSPTEALASP